MCVCARVWLSLPGRPAQSLFTPRQSHTRSCQSPRPRQRRPLPGGASARKQATLAVSDAATGGAVPAVHLPLWQILLPAMIQFSTEGRFRGCHMVSSPSGGSTAAWLDEPVHANLHAFHPVRLSAASLSLRHRLRRESQYLAALDLKPDLQRH